MWQTYGLSPECNRLCTSSVDQSLNRFWHTCAVEKFKSFKYFYINSLDDKLPMIHLAHVGFLICMCPLMNHQTVAGGEGARANFARIWSISGVPSHMALECFGRFEGIAAHITNHRAHVRMRFDVLPQIGGLEERLRTQRTIEHTILFMVDFCVRLECRFDAERSPAYFAFKGTWHLDVVLLPHMLVVQCERFLAKIAECSRMHPLVARQMPQLSVFFDALIAFVGTRIVFAGIKQGKSNPATFCLWQFDVVFAQHMLLQILPFRISLLAFRAFWPFVLDFAHFSRILCREQFGQWFAIVSGVFIVVLVVVIVIIPIIFIIFSVLVFVVTMVFPIASFVIGRRVIFI